MDPPQDNPVPHCGILNIPEEVFSDYVFPHLKYVDLLRLRRVCKHIKLFSEDFIRNHKCGFNHKREINETNRTISDYIQMDLPSCNIHLINSGPEFFQAPKIREFLKLYAPAITHLRVKVFSACVVPAENRFFTRLKSLKHLEFDEIDASKCTNICFPSSFKLLKTLKLNEVQGCSKGDMSYAWKLLEYCSKLEHFRHPFPTEKGDISATSDDDLSGHVLNYVNNRAEFCPFEPNLKFYDIRHLTGDHSDAMFVMLYFNRGTKFLNFDAQRYDNFRPTNYANFPKCVDHILSLRNLNGCMLWVELPYLERLVITATSKCTFKKAWIGDIPKWPSLNKLDITIDSVELLETEFIPKCPTLELIQFLFGTVKREKVVELGMRFKTSGEPEEAQLPCPRAQDIVERYPNVTKLYLTNWQRTNKTVSRLWSGLVHLELVEIEDCKLLGNVAFVGEDKENPTFLKLTKLKKFGLKGLEQMPKITDLIFVLVFRHLKIKEFCLTSREPMKSVTTNGIRSLLTGDFNNFVEKFSFHGWSLENVSDQEFLQLKDEFRSSHML